MEPVTSERRQGQHPITKAPAKGDAARLGEVANRGGNVTDPKAEMHRLYQELGVEHEIVRVALERDRLQHTTAVDPKAAVEVAQVLPEPDVLDESQEPVAEVLPPGHPPEERFSA